MTRLLLTLVLTLWGTQAFAHDPRSAAVEVYITGSAATVHLAISQAGLHAALESAAGHPIDAQADNYGALVADHLRRTLRFSISGQPLPIGDVGLRLGDHQSDARFAIAWPSDADVLTLDVDVLNGVAGHLTIVRVHHRGETTRTILTEAVERAVTVDLSDRPASGVERVTFADASSAPSPPARWVMVVGLAALVFSLLVAAFRRLALSGKRAISEARD